MRLRAIIRWKDRYKITLTPIPKVRLKIFYRPDGSWHYSWGHISYKHLVDAGVYYDEHGRYIYNGRRAGMSGQGCTIKSFWRHVQKEAYYNNIHPLDIVA